MPTSPIAPWEPPRRLFKANELNVVGWTALVSAALTTGIVAGVTARTLALPLERFAVGGAASVLALAVAADRRHFRSLYLRYSEWSVSETAEVEALASRLRAMGLDVTYEPAEEVEPGDGPGLRIRQRDWPAVQRFINAQR